MNQNKLQTNFYQKKRNIKSNKNIKAHIDNPLNKKYSKKTINIILKRKKLHLLSPPQFSNNPKISAYIKPPKKEISNRISREKDLYNIRNQKLFEDNINYNTLDEINEYKYLLQRPKVNIRINSTKHNKNTISSEKNNNPIKYKIHKLKPKNLKFQENSVISPSESISTVNNNKISYNIFNSIQNSFESSETNFSRKKREYSSLNYYFNIVQEKSLNKLNNNIENIIKGQNYTNSFNTTTKKYSYLNKNNNIKKINKYENKSNKNIKCNKIKIYNKILYLKKIQWINDNFSGTFSDINTLEKDKFTGKKNNSKYIYDNKTKLDFFSNNKTFDDITYNYETPNKSDFNSNNIKVYEEMNSIKKNSSIFVPTPIYPWPNISTKKDYIRIENYNNNLMINNSNKSDTIDFIEGIENYCHLDNIKKVNNNNSKINRNSLLTSKKLYNFNTPKSSTIIIGNKNNKSKNNTNKINYYIKNNYNNKLKKTLNCNINNKTNKNIPKNANKNININHSLGYSNSITDYNTINTMNSSENKIENYFNFKDINDKKIQNMTIYEDYIKPNYFNLNKKIYLNHKKDILTPINSLKPKKLKNVITSIQYRNLNNSSNLSDANIILSEYDYNGKLNIKVKKMKKSIEKVIKENSSKKDKSLIFSNIPNISNEVLTYIKKNQGIYIPKITKYNTINKI